MPVYGKRFCNLWYDLLSSGSQVRILPGVPESPAQLLRGSVGDSAVTARLVTAGLDFDL